jgi:hypothetical protein
MSTLLLLLFFELLIMIIIDSCYLYKTVSTPTIAQCSRLTVWHSQISMTIEFAHSQSDCQQIQNQVIFIRQQK